MNLLLAQCTPQRESLPIEQLPDWLAQVPAWRADPEHKLIARRFAFDNFSTAFVIFLTSLALAFVGSGSPTVSGVRSSSAKRSVSARSTPFSARMATRYSLPRMTKVATPARSSTRRRTGTRAALRSSPPVCS